MNLLKNILAIINSIVLVFKSVKYIRENPAKIQFYLCHKNTMKGMKLLLILTFVLLAYSYNLIHTFIYLKSSLSITIHKISSISFLILTTATVWFLIKLYQGIDNDRNAYLKKEYSMKKA